MQYIIRRHKNNFKYSQILENCNLNFYIRLKKQKKKEKQKAYPMQILHLIKLGN